MRTAYVVAPEADAADAVQDAFVKAYAALSRFRDGAPIRPWLLRIVANEARNRRRSADRRAGLAVRADEEAIRALVVEGAAMRIGEASSLGGHDRRDLRPTVSDVDDDRATGRIEIRAAVVRLDGRPVRLDGDRWLGRGHAAEDATGAHRGILADGTPGPEERSRGFVRLGNHAVAGAASTMGFTTVTSVSMVSASYGAGSSTRNVWKPIAR